MSQVTPGRYRIHNSEKSVEVKVYLHPDRPKDDPSLLVLFEGDETQEEFPLEAIVADKWERLDG